MKNLDIHYIFITLFIIAVAYVIINNIAHFFFLRSRVRKKDHCLRKNRSLTNLRSRVRIFKEFLNRSFSLESSKDRISKLSLKSSNELFFFFSFRISAFSSFFFSFLILSFLFDEQQISKYRKDSKSDEDHSSFNIEACQ